MTSGSLGLFDLRGHVALVTGAGQGIGREIALTFARHNANGVVINDYFQERADAVVKEIEAAGGRAIAAVADVADSGAVRAAISLAEGEFGPIDILVNNAGGVGPAPDWAEIQKPFWEVGPETWKVIMGVNLYGVINCSGACIPSMIRSNGGRIITIISEAGRLGTIANVTADTPSTAIAMYWSAKAGAAGFTRALARSLGQYQITANCISIGHTLTPSTEAGLTGDAERLHRILIPYAIKRVGSTSDVASMALLLASDAGSWITGQTYPVNGGLSFAL